MLHCLQGGELIVQLDRPKSKSEDAKKKKNCKELEGVAMGTNHCRYYDRL